MNTTKEKFVFVITTAAAAAFMGLLHLVQAGHSGLSVYPPLALLGTVAGWAVIYRRVLLSRSAWHAALWAMWAGFVYFAVSIHWVGSALIPGDADSPAEIGLAAAASLGCTAIFFPWWGAAALAAKAWCPSSPVGGAYAFAAFWGISDFLLGDFIYGIPLGSISLAAMDTPAAGLLPVLGTQGASIVIVWTGAILGGVGIPGWRPLQVTTPVMTATAACWVAIWAPQKAPTPPAATVALAQLNFPVPIDGGAAAYSEELERVVLATAAASFTRGADLVVFPESTSLSDLTAEGSTLLPALQSLIPEGSAVLVGARSVETAGTMGANDTFSVDIYNTALLVTDHGVVEQYRKTHLAIFGEYMPWIFRIMGFDVIGGPTGGLSKGDGLQTLAIGNLPPALITICYEALMSGPMRRAAASATWHLNISNEYLFGTSSGPALIQQYNRMRSLELGLPTLRATMTGYSGVIDARGEIAIEAPYGSSEVMLTELPPSVDTPFRRIGYAPTYGMITLFLVMSLMGRRKA